MENYGHTSISQALATVPVLVSEPGTGSGTGTGTGFHWWFRYWCEIQFRSDPKSSITYHNQLSYNDKGERTLKWDGYSDGIFLHPYIIIYSGSLRTKRIKTLTDP